MQWDIDLSGLDLGDSVDPGSWDTSSWDTGTDTSWWDTSGLWGSTPDLVDTGGSFPGLTTADPWGTTIDSETFSYVDPNTGLIQYPSGAETTGGTTAGGTTGGGTNWTDIMKLAATVGGALAKSLAGGTQPGTTARYSGTSTTQTPLAPLSQLYAYQMADLINPLYNYLGLNPYQSDLYNRLTVSAQNPEFLTGFPASTWNQIIGGIPSTQQAMEAATSQALGRMAPRMLSLGPGIQNIVGEVAKTDTATRQLLTNALIQKAAAEQSALANIPGRFSSLEAALGAPEAQYRNVAMGAISPALGNLINIWQSGQPRTTTGGGTQTFQYQPTSFMSNIGSALLNNAGAIGGTLGGLLS